MSRSLFENFVPEVFLTLIGQENSKIIIVHKSFLRTRHIGSDPESIGVGTFRFVLSFSLVFYNECQTETKQNKDKERLILIYDGIRVFYRSQTYKKKKLNQNRPPQCL